MKGVQFTRFDQLRLAPHPLDELSRVEEIHLRVLLAQLLERTLTETELELIIDFVIDLVTVEEFVLCVGSV